MAKGKEPGGKDSGRDEGESGAQASPEQQLLAKIKFNKYLLIGVSVLSLLVVSTLGTGLFVMLSRVGELQSQLAKVAETEDRFTALETELEKLTDFRKSELRRIALYTRQLEQVQLDCKSDKAKQFRLALADREQDFQLLMTTVTDGTSSLAGMARGSRQWVDVHNKTLKELAEKSAEREKTLRADNG